MTRLIVDGREIDIPPDYMLLLACEFTASPFPKPVAVAAE